MTPEFFVSHSNILFLPFFELSDLVRRFLEIKRVRFCSPADLPAMIILHPSLARGSGRHWAGENG